MRASIDRCGVAIAYSPAIATNSEVWAFRGKFLLTVCICFTSLPAVAENSAEPMLSRWATVVGERLNLARAEAGLLCDAQLAARLGTGVPDVETIVRGPLGVPDAVRLAVVLNVDFEWLLALDNLRLSLGPNQVTWSGKSPKAYVEQWAKRVGEHLKSAMRTRKIAQHRLAAQLQISQSLLSRLQTGDLGPSFEQARTSATALEIDLDKFLDVEVLRQDFGAHPEWTLEHISRNFKSIVEYALPSRSSTVVDTLAREQVMDPMADLRNATSSMSLAKVRDRWLTSVGARLRAQIRLRGLTQKMTAQHLEVSQSNMSLILSGQVALDEAKARRLAPLLEVNYEWLLGFDILGPMYLGQLGRLSFDGPPEFKDMIRASVKSSACENFVK